MKANKNSKKLENLYVKQLKKTLLCSASMKKAFIKEIKDQIAELKDQIQDLSMEDLQREIGKPDEIARGFESRDNIEDLKKRAKKYSKAKTISLVFLVLTIFAIAILIIIIVKSNKEYHSKTTISTTIEEI